MRVSGDVDVWFQREDGSAFTRYDVDVFEAASVQPSREYNFYPIDTMTPLIARFAFEDDDPVFITVEVWRDGVQSGAWGQLSNKRDQYGRFVVYAQPGAMAEISMTRRKSLRLHLDNDGDGEIDEIREPQGD